MSKKEVNYLAASGAKYKWRPGPVDTTVSFEQFERAVSALNEGINILVKFGVRREDMVITMSERFKDYVKGTRCQYPTAVPFYCESENMYATYMGIKVEIDDSVDFYTIERGGIIGD